MGCQRWQEVLYFARQRRRYLQRLDDCFIRFTIDGREIIMEVSRSNSGLTFDVQLDTENYEEKVELHEK